MKNPKFIQASPADSIEQIDQYSTQVSVTDFDTPYSFDTWMVNFGTPGGSPEKQELAYREYLSRWNATKTSENINTSYRQQYVDYLKQLTYPYVFTQEERRIANTTDYDNEFEIDSISYIFAKRTKQICEFVRQQRNELKFQSIKTQQRCTTTGVERIIYNDVLRLLEDEDVKAEYSNLLSTDPNVRDELSLVKDELRVQLTELYDIEQGYYGDSLDPEFTDLNRGKTAELYNRITFDPYIFIDENIAQINIINKYSMQTDMSLETGNVLTIPLDSSISSIQDLPPNEFINYTPSSDNLTIATTRKLIENSIGTSLYYTKTDSAGDIESTGILVEPTVPEKNLLNRGTPAVNIVSNTNTKTRTIQQIGGYYTPNKLGVLTYSSLSPGITIDTDRIEPDTLYVYPDPNKHYTNTEVYNFTEHPTIPIKFNEKVKWLKATKSSDQQSGDIIDSQKLQKFYNYSSDTEINKYSKFGISRFDDPYDFWSGEKSDVWANADVYIADQLKNLPFESRQESLLSNAGQVDKWKTDIYGNEYALLKPSSNYEFGQEPIAECDKSKYQSAVGCRVYDGIDLKNVMTGLPVYELGVDGGSSHPMQDVSQDLNLLTQFGMTCRNGSCQPGSRWLTDSRQNPGRESGFKSNQQFEDVANAGFFLPNLCLQDEQESVDVNICRIIDGYSVEVPARYTETDYYELSGTWFEGLADQDGDFYDPPFDDIWDAGYFNTVCSPDQFGPAFRQNTSTKYIEPSLQFANTTESTELTNDSNNNIYSTQQQQGTLFVRDLASRYTDTSTTVLGKILAVIPQERMVNNNILNPREQLTNQLIDFDIVKDIIILYSENFIYLNKFNYDYDNGEITPDHTSGVLIDYDRETDVPLKHFYNELTDEIVVGVLRYFDKESTDQINSLLSPVNMYRVSVSSLTLSPKKLNWPVTGFTLPTSVLSIDTTGDGFITYNEQLNYYYVTTSGKLSDSVSAELFYVYQIRFSLDRDVPTAVYQPRPELYTSGSLSTATSEFANLDNTNSPSIDENGLQYYNLSEYLNDDYKKTEFSYDTIDQNADNRNPDWINNRLLVNSADDHNIGTTDTSSKSFVALFPPGSIATFYLKLNISSMYTLAETSNDQVYKVEARFARPDISETHIDKIEFNRSPLPNYSAMDITKLVNTDDLTDPRQNNIVYEYNFQSSPSQCSDTIIDNCTDTAMWDNPAGSIAPDVKLGQLYKFVVILHMMSGERYYYPYKFILSPFNAGNCLNDVRLVNVTSFVDTEFHESTLLVFESQNPKYIAPVVLRTETLDKITFYSSEVTDVQNNISTVNTNYMTQETTTTIANTQQSTSTATVVYSSPTVPTPVTPAVPTGTPSSPSYY